MLARERLLHPFFLLFYKGTDFKLPLTNTEILQEMSFPLENTSMSSYTGSDM